MQSVSYDEALERVGFGRFPAPAPSCLRPRLGRGRHGSPVGLLRHAGDGRGMVAFCFPEKPSRYHHELGMLIGALFWGRICDRIGRRIGFVLTIAFYSLFGFLFRLFAQLRMVSRSPTADGLRRRRLSVDLGMFSEYLPTKNRGRRLVYLEAFWALGTVFAARGIAWLVVPSLGWRALFAFSALPGFLLYAVRRGVPQSPRYLFVKGRIAEARAVLERVAAVNGTGLQEGELAPDERDGSIRDERLARRRPPSRPASGGRPSSFGSCGS